MCAATTSLRLDEAPSAGPLHRWLERGRLRPVLHGAFWLSVLLFYTFYFGRNHARYGDSLLFVGLLLPITAGTTYFLTHFLIPRYLLRKRYAAFALTFLGTLIVSIDLELVVVLLLLVWVAVTRREPLNPAAYDVYSLVVGMYLVVFLGVALSLLERAYRMQQANQELERRRLETELKLREAELLLLRTQIQPHFLFNTLNSLYALTLERSDRAPDVVLRLSDMLDYVLHRGSSPRVNLEEEVVYLRNYMELERLRYGERVTVSFRTDGPLSAHRVAPLLLIPLVENAFKHGVGRVSGAARIDMTLTVIDGRLAFRVVNRLPERAPHGPDRHRERLGLDNLRRQLRFHYRDWASLDAGPDGDRFVAVLHIDLQEEGWASAV